MTGFVWIDAVLLKEDLAMLVGQFAPVTIRLGEDGELHVLDPSDISVAPGVGLRVVCKAKLRWTVLGITVPATLNSLVILVRPEIAQRAGVDMLIFRLVIEHADFAGLPTGVDNRLTELVNRELESMHVELSWDYAATLSHVFDLSPRLRPLERLKLTVGGARVKATEEALALAIEFHAEVLRGEAGSATSEPRPERAAQAGYTSPGGALPPATKKPVRRRMPVIVCGLAACALVGTYWLGRSRR